MWLWIALGCLKSEPEPPGVVLDAPSDTAPEDTQPVDDTAPQDTDDTVPDDTDDTETGDTEDTGDTDPPTEDCTDGDDNDGDGLTDCFDPDCFSEDCTEWCMDGADNDVDGLIDCEDGDCAADRACSEVAFCSGGWDEDADGLIDCQDDDCWGQPECDGTTVWVTGGEAWRTWTRRVDVQAAGTSSCSEQQVTALLDVTGSARWQGASSSSACTWTVDHAVFAASDACGASSWGVSLQERAGFEMTGGCGLTTATGLPTHLGTYVGTWFRWDRAEIPDVGSVDGWYGLTSVGWRNGGTTTTSWSDSVHAGSERYVLRTGVLDVGRPVTRP